LIPGRKVGPYIHFDKLLETIKILVELSRDGKIHISLLPIGITPR
jgi:hypothetical protein